MRGGHHFNLRDKDPQFYRVSPACAEFQVQANHDLRPGGGESRQAGDGIVSQVAREEVVQRHTACINRRVCIPKLVELQQLTLLIGQQQLLPTDIVSW